MTPEEPSISTYLFRSCTFTPNLTPPRLTPHHLLTEPSRLRHDETLKWDRTQVLSQGKVKVHRGYGYLFSGSEPENLLCVLPTADPGWRLPKSKTGNPEIVGIIDYASRQPSSVLQPAIVQVLLRA